MSEEEIKNKYQNSLNDIIHNCKGFPCKNDSFYNMQELVDKSYLEYLKLQQENKKLKQIIDNVIKEINKLIDFSNKYDEPTNNIDLKEVLKILKGDK